MATYVLIHGAGGDSWYWHRVVPLLDELGHDVVAPDLPSDDDAAGFTEYADAVVEAIGDRRDLVIVAQSMGSFTGLLVCERLPVDEVIFVAAMVPRVGETGGEWWVNKGWVEQRGDQEMDAVRDFFHDVPPDVTAEAMARGERAQSGTPFEQPYPLKAWPDVKTRFILCRNDRFFPADFQRRVVKERLGITPEEMEGGHLPALAHPTELVEHLTRRSTSPPDGGR